MKMPINSDCFLYPRTTYRGKFTPESLAFNANLQEFAQKTAYISGLHSNGKISSVQAYTQIKSLWQQLQQSQENLHINKSTEK